MAVVLLQLLEQEGLAVAVLVGLGQQTERLVQPTEAVVAVVHRVLVLPWIGVDIVMIDIMGVMVAVVGMVDEMSLHRRGMILDIGIGVGEDLIEGMMIGEVMETGVVVATES